LVTSLYWAVLEKARESGVAGCTVIRGVAGFGASSVIHQAKPFRFSSDLPIIIEIVDMKERVQKLLAEVRPILQGGDGHRKARSRGHETRGGARDVAQGHEVTSDRLPA